MPEPIQGTYVCGDGQCASFLGENQDNCPSDCLSQVSPGGDLPAGQGESSLLQFDINPMIVVAGILMMLTLIIPLIYWRKKTKVLWRFFILGAVFWLVNFIIKVALDLTITPYLLPLLGIFLFAFHFGIRTGTLEVLFPYFVIRSWKRLRNVNWSKAVAFSIGFGGLENFILGLHTAAVTLLFTFVPRLLASLPANIRAEYLASLSSSSWIVFAPALERTAALFIHLLACVLIFLAVRTGKQRYLWYSFLYKAVIDGTALFLNKIPAPSFLIFAYLVQIPIVIYGIIGVWGLLKIKKKYPEEEKV